MAAHAAVAEERELQQRLARIDQLVGELQELPDPAAWARAEEVIGTVLDLHGRALVRLLELIREPEADGTSTLIDRIADDELVRGVLLIHDLHPIDLRTRVERALESVRPYMRSHGGGVTLIGVAGEVVRIKLEGHCQGCPSSMMTLKLAVEKAIYEAAPDVIAIEVEGIPDAAPHQPPDPSGLVLLPLAPGTPAAPPRTAPVAPAAVAGDWEVAAIAASEVPDNGVVRTSVAAIPVVLSRLGAILYAYKAECPGCRADMAGARLDGAALICPACEAGYDVRRAGRGTTSADRLEPLPLLDERGVIRIAIPAGSA